MYVVPVPGRRSLVVGMTLAALLAGCAEEPPPPEPVTRPVKIFEVGGADAARTFEYPGVVEAVQHAELGFEVSGQIVEFPVDEGQMVEAGQEIAHLDPRDYDAQLDAQQARARAARADFDRMRVLFEKEVSSEQELDVARRNYEVTVASVRTAQKAVDDTVLRAPFAGVVARKLVKDFRNVQAKEPVVILQDDSGLQVVVAVPERDWVWADPDEPRDARNQTIQPHVSVTNYPDLTFPATLREVATTADPATRTFAVTIGFDAPSGINVLPGMTAKAILDVPVGAATGALTIPARAVVQNEGATPYVWRIDPSAMTASRAEVGLGELTGDEIEITRGLRQGDQIATSGVHQLRDGMAVSRFQ